ncbi:glycoside hydrolase family 76 protein [Polychaeton citri CBS 116435]|uniref:Mannan endo-1,6-alpha-mannosidase n=1 Tax=Polychaeton citri CBS 116435 TaxID=1314669 RepID=A0A9P4QCB2_9PEZI|nr:glycoside hydrolase family 76 protein [Polychaeton citri CBS 116435]
MRLLSSKKVSAALLLVASQQQFVSGLQLDVNSQENIREVASTVAYGLMKWYHGNETGQTPGMLPYPFYWWEAGAMFGTIIDYWYFTGDDTYNDNVIEAMIHQASPTINFMPPNQTRSEGNDDQGFWGLAVMEAAEVKFPNPPASDPQWVELAQGVFNSQAERWDDSACAGGLKWQIFPWNNGYNYKNSISNGCFFQIAARLGAYTDNQTYYDWASRTYDWMESIGLVGPDGNIYDGTNDLQNCSEINHMEWSYNSGIMMYGSAVMWNKTEGAERQKWNDRVYSILNATTRNFFTNDQIMYEAACEAGKTCNQDQVSFKAYLSRWMSATAKVMPSTHDIIMPMLAKSAVAAAQSCSGGTDGVTCGTQWTVTGWDGMYGPGQQMSALEVIQSNLIDRVSGPVSNTTGGTSRGNPSAGTGGSANGPIVPPDQITTGDKAGAGILTALVLILILGGAWWMVA